MGRRGIFEGCEKGILGVVVKLGILGFIFGLLGRVFCGSGLFWGLFCEFFSFYMVFYLLK